MVQALADGSRRGALWHRRCNSWRGPDATTPSPGVAAALAFGSVIRALAENSMNLLVLALVGATYHVPVYHSAHGPVALSPAPDAVALRVPAQAVISRLALKHPEVQVEGVYGGVWLLTGVADPQALRREAAGIHGVVVLEPYRLPGVRSYYIADERIRAQFPLGVSEADANRRAKAAGAVSARLLRRDLSLFEVVTANPSRTVEVAARLQESHAALWAHPDFYWRIEKRFVPDDPLFADQWHHENIGSTGAWETKLGSPDVIIAIIDSGTDMTHPDLVGKIVSPRDEVYQDDDPTPDPTDAHGTSTSGLAAATGNNGIGVSGVCPACSLMPIRIMTEAGDSRMGADSDAFYWASDHGAQVLSNSWGPDGAAPIPSDLNLAINTVTNSGRSGAGSVILFAAGNDGRANESYELASHPLVLSIGATSYWDELESYSDYGPDLDLPSPAGAVTTDISGTAGYESGDYTTQFNGTSAATPVAAGVAAIVYCVAPELTRAQVHSILFETADKIGGVTYDVNGFEQHYGYGRVNALRAVQKAAGRDVCQPVTEICDDGIDNDCDWLVDNADPSCAPTTVTPGITCNQDFQCGMGGSCLFESMGFAGGYCTTSCTDTCPGDATCLQTRNGGYCLDSCTKIDDCRPGYDCLSPSSGPAVCLPSCTVDGCVQGETCNTTTGVCFHNGPTHPGGSCTADLDCADNGWCVDQLPDGYCLVECTVDADCVEGHYCIELGMFAACLQTCTRNTDCRSQYSCWPEADGTASCWASCTSTDDCNGDVCNEWGLCGTDTPPDTSPPPVDEPPADVPANTCACNTTYSCDDSCSCDPECKDGDRGCIATQSSSLSVLLGFALMARIIIRRRNG